MKNTYALLLLSVASLCSTAVAQSRPERVCDRAECRPKSVASVRVGAGEVAAVDVEGFPITVGTEIYLFAGEVFAVEAQIEDHDIVGFKRVNETVVPDRTLAVGLTQNDKPPGSLGTSLFVRNPFGEPLRYDLTIIRVDQNGQREEVASACPVEPGAVGVEHFPYPVLAATLKAFRLVSRDGVDASCHN